MNSGRTGHSCPRSQHLRLPGGAAGAMDLTDARVSDPYVSDMPMCLICLCVRCLCVRCLVKSRLPVHPQNVFSAVQNMEFLIESTFSRNTQTLGVVEVEPSALISKTASADTDDVDAKKKECVRILKRLRAAQYTEDEEASMKTWAYKTWHKLGLRLLTEADLGHQKGDNIRLVFKNFDTGGAGTVDSQEFMQGLAKYKIRPTTKKSYQDLFELCDEGRYGEVHYEDFSRWVRGPHGCISIEAEIDLDKDRFFAKLWENYEGALQLKRSDNVVHRNKVMDARAEDGQKEKHYATSAKHKFSGPAATRGGVPYFWLSTSPGSTFLGFKPSHDRFSITNATPNKDQVDHPLAHLRALRATVHAVRTFQSQGGGIGL